MIYFLRKYRKQRKEIEDLQKTIESLKDQATSIHKEFHLILNGVNATKKPELEWFEDSGYLCSVLDNGVENYRRVQKYADYLKKEKDVKYIMCNPSLKVKKTYHGGCGGCITPLEDGLKSCLGCKYFNGVTSSYPDLSKKYNDKSIN